MAQCARKRPETLRMLLDAASVSTVSPFIPFLPTFTGMEEGRVRPFCISCFCMILFFKIKDASVCWNLHSPQQPEN